MEHKRMVMMGAASSLAFARIVIAAVPRERFHNFDLGDFKPLLGRKRRTYPTLADSLGKRRFIKSSKR